MFAAIFLVTVYIVYAAASVPYSSKTYYDLEDADNLYRQFIAEHNKQYSLAEQRMRFEIFKDKLTAVNKLNAEHPNTVYTIYHFADWTPEELNGHFGFKIGNASINAVEPIFPEGFVDPPPKAFDWRDQGVVSPVKNQGSCGSCYIFSAIGNIEGQYARKHNECLSLSEQQVMDCLPDCGCSGGFMDQVMKKLSEDKAGCVKEEDYPYVGEPQKQCSEKNDKKVATVVSDKVLNIEDEDVLLQALLEYGPLSVSLNGADFHHYRSGVLEPNACRDQLPNHGVLLVGYGEDNNVKYWIIKNSWGAKWGENGYVRLLRGVNACSVGISYTATAEVA